MNGHRVATLLLCWLGLYCTFACVAYGNLETLDSVFTMHAARNLWRTGDSGLRLPDDGAESVAEGVGARVIHDQARVGRHSYGKQGVHDRRQYVWFPVGHVWLMAPCVAVGEAIAARVPWIEDRYRRLKIGAETPPARWHETTYREGQFVLAQAAVALTLPAAFGAASVLLLFLLARTLGNPPRLAMLSAASIALATQFFPLGRETLSDGPGMAFLLLALLATVRCHQGSAAGGGAFIGGLAAGCAVLSRYQHGFLVAVLAVAVAVAALRQRRAPLLLAFVGGGLPCLGALLLTNHARFGDFADTGYPPAGTWFNYPIWLGLPKLLIAAGKGILWFSPLLWLAVPLACRRANVPALRGLAFVLFAIPLLMFSATSGWQSGQCWGARYVTAGVVTFLALVVPQAQPWRRWPRSFALLCCLGVAVNVTSVVAPTRGHNQLAGQGVRALYEPLHASGAIGDQEWDQLDEADHYFFLPRFSPLHAHWSYAWQSLGGGFEDASGRPRNGAAHTIEPLFGVTSANPAYGLAPIHWEDRACRHLWWRCWGAILDVPGWMLLLPVAGCALFLSTLGLRRLSRE
jgi:hypothetical protein